MNEERQAIFEEFKNGCMDLMTNRFIMSKIKTERILGFIAQCPPLIDFFKVNCDGINYYNELNNCFRNSRFSMPSGYRLTIVIVLGILDDIDKGDLLLTEFLASVYPNTEPNAAFEYFGNDFILPFVDAVYNLFVLQGNEDATLKQLDTLRYEAIGSELAPVLNRMNDLIKGDNSLKSHERETYYSVIEGFYHSIATNNEVIIKTAYLSCRNTIKNSHRYKADLREMARILSKYIKL